MKRILSSNHRTTAAKVTAELIIHLKDPVSTTTVRRKLHKSIIQGTATIVKRLLKTTLKGPKDGVIIIKSGLLMIGKT